MVGLAAVMLGMLAQPAVAQSEESEGEAEAPKPSLDAFQGHYMYSGGDRQKQAIRDEIDAATEDLNIALRGLARRKIWKSQQPSTMMTILVDGDDVSIVRSGGKAEFVGSIAGGSFPVEDKYRGRFKWRSGKLTVNITGGDQHTTVRFTVNPDSRTVTMRTTIEHDMLPRPVRIKKTFRAVGG